MNIDETDRRMYTGMYEIMDERMADAREYFNEGCIPKNAFNDEFELSIYIGASEAIQAGLVYAIEDSIKQFDSIMRGIIDSYLGMIFDDHVKNAFAHAIANAVGEIEEQPKLQAIASAALNKIMGYDSKKLISDAMKSAMRDAMINSVHDSVPAAIKRS